MNSYTSARKPASEQKPMSLMRLAWLVRHSVPTSAMNCCSLTSSLMSSRSTLTATLRQLGSMQLYTTPAPPAPSRADMSCVYLFSCRAVNGMGFSLAISLRKSSIVVLWITESGRSGVSSAAAPPSLLFLILMMDGRPCSLRYL
jgi:hypothetical protein